MKKDIHPDYVDDRGHLHLRRDVHHAQHRRRAASSTPTCARSATRSTRASRRSSTPAAASPGSRSATPGGPEQEVAQLAGAGHPAGWPVPCISASSRSVRPAQESTVFEAVEGARRPSATSSSSSSRTRRPTPTRRSRKRLNQRYAEVSSIVRAWEEWRRLGDDLEAARELGGRRRRLRRGGDARWRPGRETAAERLRHLLVPREPADSKDAILEVKSGEGGEESALFAGDLLRMYTRYAERPRLDDRGARRDRVRPRRLQVRHGRGQGPRRQRAGRGAVRPAEVRGRRPPRAAGAGHRVPGPGPHQRGRRAGAAGGRAGRRPASTTTTCASTSSAAAARAARASTPPTPRSGSPTCRPASWSAARTRRASSRTASRRCGSCGRGCSRPPRTRPTPRRARPGAARSAPSTAPSGSAPTTSRRTGSPTTAPATRPTTSTRSSTATSTRCSTPASRPTSRPGWPRSEP